MPNLSEIKLTIGIPSQVVHYTLLGIGGTYNGGIKCDPDVIFDLDRTGSGSMTFASPQWGTTHEYAEADSVRVANKPDWYRTLKSGAKPLQSKQLARTPDNLDAKFHQMEGATHAVQFTVVGPNPLHIAARPIDAKITVGLRKVDGKMQYAIQGEHDGFPDYAIEINNKRVYSWDCVAKGKTPGALGLPTEDVEVRWQSL